MILRPYQSEMVAAVRAKWEAGTLRVLGSLPTGGGKTEVAIALALEHATPLSRVLIVVALKSLCGQWVKRLKRHGCDRVGILQGSNTIGTSAPVLVAMAQTIRSRGVPEDVSLIVIDESHVWHTTHDKVLELAGSAARVLGLTATPLRAGLGLRFDAMVTGETIRGLIAGGYLVQPRYFAPKGDALEDALEDVAIRAGDFATDELSRAMRGKAIIGDVVGTWLARGEGRQSIAFCVDKAHAAMLCDEFNAAGIAADVVVDETADEDRARIFAGFDARSVRVLVSVGVLSVGFDSPVASCAILARPTMSLSLHIQQGGRVLRTCESKVDALILDHAGNTLRHGLLEDFAPPTELSMIDTKADKKSRRDMPIAWTCRACEAINALGCDTCVECGTPRRRQTTACIIDGELIEVDVVAGEELPGPTPDAVREFYLMARWQASRHGLKDGWGFHATKRRFHFDDDDARRWIAWRWREAATIAPDAATARWFAADYQRARIARRYEAGAQQSGPPTR